MECCNWRGKILSYDSIKGVGKIIIKNQGIKLFSVDNWIDYNVTPTVGLEVEFGIENDKIIDILSSNSSEILSPKQYKLSIII